MKLNAQTEIGLTFGQILSLIGIVAFFILGYSELNLRISQIEAKTIALEKVDVVHSAAIETVRTENRQDHERMFQKFDQIIMFQKTNR